MKEEKFSERLFSWKEIRKAVEQTYEKDGHYDDWGVPVVYREVFLKGLKKNIKTHD